MVGVALVATLVPITTVDRTSDFKNPSPGLQTLHPHVRRTLQPGSQIWIPSFSLIFEQCLAHLVDSTFPGQ